LRNCVASQNSDVAARRKDFRKIATYFVIRNAILCWPEKAARLVTQTGISRLFSVMMIAPPAKYRSAMEDEARPGFKSPGLDFAVMPGLRGSEISLTVRPLPGEGLGEIFGRLATRLEILEATMVHLTVFGNVNAAATGTAALRQIFGDIDWPSTWVEGSACDDRPIAGLQALAFAGGGVRRIRMSECVIGSVFEDGAFRHCFLGGVTPDTRFSSRADQTKQTLERWSEGFERGGFSFGDVARTWFFLDDLLAWYGEFNAARTQFYSGIKFRSGSLPASTGVGAGNPGRVALAACAWAMKPLTRAAYVEEVASPLQCPAPAYGSSFSRAMEVSSGAGRRLFISGTASIAPEGQTLWRGDTRKQIAQTMQVVEAILQSRGFSPAHLSRATAYFKHRADFRTFNEWRLARGLPAIPVILANCQVCRDDLLFEIELDAWRTSQKNGWTV
jgi:enamine deaminase RidA (YjgF/YER057c/UK114 family)